ncbi:MAG: DUF378 domain-containing protein [bacterium]|nr:DUF378 domain-containing protein [bacterium]
MKGLNGIALLLVVVGGLNWGTVGLMQLDLVASVLGAGSMLTNLVYDLVGLAALYVGVTVLPKQFS